LGFALALPSNSKTGMERVTKGKHSSLFGLIDSDEVKKFNNIVTKSRLIQNFDGAFSANFDFPKVKTAPVSGTSGSSDILASGFGPQGVATITT